ncbi:MAG: sigma-70 family RNA polymerase sigma factor [Acidobacteriota bacterium]
MGDDFELLKSARSGSPEALNRLFARYGHRLLALIRLRMGPSLRRQLESQDVLQQTLLKAFKRFDQFDGDGETTLMGWFGAIARNEIRDQAKYQHRKGRDVDQMMPLDAALELVDPVRTEVSRLQFVEDARRLESAIEALDEKHREILLLRRFEELSFPQIGRHLDKSPDACRMLYSRAMTALTIRLQRQAHG